MKKEEIYYEEEYRRKRKRKEGEDNVPESNGVSREPMWESVWRWGEVE